MKNQKGITLIALVITIIVMLILVGVSVTVALNGGLFTTAQDATDRTKAERDNELVLSDGKVEINGEWYNSIDEYVKGSTAGAKVEILPKKETYTVGEEVTIGEEAFYVIADNTEKVTLLAKDCIDTTNLVQSETPSEVMFCEESAIGYWWSEGETGDYDIVEPEPTLDEETGKLTLPDSHIAAKAAYDYGVKVGGIGRLLTSNEAVSLDTTNEYKNILYGINGKSSRESLEYWLGSVVQGGNTEFTVYSIYGFLELFRTGDLSIYGVRPVVEISKSNIS